MRYSSSPVPKANELGVTAPRHQDLATGNHYGGTAVALEVCGGDSCRDPVGRGYTVLPTFLARHSQSAIPSGEVERPPRIANAAGTSTQVPGVFGAAGLD
jgi:hypothetical protein